MSAAWPPLDGSSRVEQRAEEVRRPHHTAWVHHGTTSDQSHRDLHGCESFWLLQSGKPRFPSYPLFVWGLERSRGNVSVQRCQQKAEEGRALKDLVNEDKKFEKTDLNSSIFLM